MAAQWKPGMLSRQFMMSYFVRSNRFAAGARSFHLTINISVSWPTLVASALANEPSRTEAIRSDPGSPTCETTQVSMNRGDAFRTQKEKVCAILYLFNKY